jgi:hypothetical protein
VTATPLSFLKQAIKAVPAVKYALGVGGVVAVIVIVVRFKIDLRIAVLGAVVMFVLMIVLVVFAKLSAQGNGFFRIPAFVVTWFAVAIIMAASFAVFTSFFWGYPLGWTSRPAPSHSETTNSEPVEKPKAAGEPLNSQQVTKLDSPCCDWLVGRWYGATRRDAENDLQFSSTAHNVLVRKCKYSWADSFVLNVGVRNERKKLMKGVLTYYHAAAEPVYPVGSAKPGAATFFCCGNKGIEHGRRMVCRSADRGSCYSDMPRLLQYFSNQVYVGRRHT